jgi:hypothetical protein
MTKSFRRNAAARIFLERPLRCQGGERAGDEKKKKGLVPGPLCLFM